MLLADGYIKLVGKRNTKIPDIFSFHRTYNIEEERKKNFLKPIKPSIASLNLSSHTYTTREVAGRLAVKFYKVHFGRYHGITYLTSPHMCMRDIIYHIYMIFIHTESLS